MIALWLLRHWTFLHRVTHPRSGLIDPGTCWFCVHSWRHLEKDPEFQRQMETAGHR